MPNMSIQSLQIGIPCSRKLWEASNGAEWRELLPKYDQDYTLLSLVKGFANSDNEMLSKPYRAYWLSFNLALHGLMSMANDILHFDNRSISKMTILHLHGEKICQNRWSHGRRDMTLSQWRLSSRCRANLSTVRFKETVWQYSHSITLHILSSTAKFVTCKLRGSKSNFRSHRYT
jgi:hypothetical protein